MYRVASARIHVCARMRVCGYRTKVFELFIPCIHACNMLCETRMHTMGTSQLLSHILNYLNTETTHLAQNLRAQTKLSDASTRVYQCMPPKPWRYLILDIDIRVMF